MKKKHIIDAKGRVPGRVATEVVMFLMGKNRADFARNKIPEIEVEVVSSSQMLLSAKKLKDKLYSHYSGFPGGLKRHSQEYVVATKGVREVLRRAVYGMLPKNKLRAQMMKNLKIND
ncbi:MAG: 50S ribosomal protein L13 [Candidatus Zambryskibacteria bacterium RIFCSPHIGHO2_02_FULL_43_14]|uniref:50S ribosomal protein L13 n=1 Tax=Candidatus Zambryskibacteria bacterium RIFCSPHIGHO2_02_FULL_43_14 TaxID=1802748 RepID=A0A1G2TGE4_9BACT|nr:MAG: 50S ribosomal protein L13 [Candidatus Zambryskibacteria bacterium RIFCSPHIGHO2_01_FULL_43_60]OHA96108.1 MAG: 50S ribosomal protein L13 [Candidatus Zambryskibacteria bacterium RIFCSPHIGHO2_02_FULL_43_14]OHB03493.1 MAG: 50S ribosomal protein L13 [Candidatus Zambryskibacteria bacterium RIFCSPLOWO2_01_FULL_42_41]